ncbi:RNase H domain-containing protein [Trichonephila clavipes]|uniref:RNase H domain-containing protein n=1 Tax=Trichonephila clavipes TaxID=2585209 RepID=A0A8X6RZA1_TRICX|nr:RNase H domain-containing protein [Trichonephila clavipes]
MSDHPELLKQMALEVIDGIPLDAAKIYTDGSKGETNTTGSGVLIELPGRVIKFQRRNAYHASVFRTELKAIMCGLSFINNIRDLAVSEIWILTDSRSSIQHLSNWPSIGDSTSRSILHLFQQLSDRYPIHLQWVPSHVGLLGNEVADDLAKAATSNPVDPENHMVLTSTEIYSRAK